MKRVRTTANMAKATPLTFTLTYTLFILFSLYSFTKIWVPRPFRLTFLFLHDDISIPIPASRNGARVVADDEIDRDAFYSSRARYFGVSSLDIVSDAVQPGYQDFDIWEMGHRGLVPKELGFQLTIHVFAWQRSHSLQRLLNSLLEAEYMGMKGIKMVIHVDGNPRKEVVDMVKAFEWPMGELVLDMKKERVGLRDVSFFFIIFKFIHNAIFFNLTI
jgi:hypothetical protein